jgi:CRP-like cAMP-binding protein
VADTSPPNLILAALPEAVRARLATDLAEVTLRQSTILAEVGEPLRQIIFPAGGAVSLVTATADGSSVEAVLIGNEGIVGTWCAAGIEGAPWRTVVQAGGPAFRLAPELFRRHIAESPELGLLVARSNVAAHLLTSQSAACNRFHELTARAARWLLMVSDRTGKDELTLTQEFLSQMLGAYRPSVTVALRTLDDLGPIQVRRNRIAIVDRPRLEALACECYAVCRTQAREMLRLNGVGE